MKRWRSIGVLVLALSGLLSLSVETGAALGANGDVKAKGAKAEKRSAKKSVKKTNKIDEKKSDGTDPGAAETDLASSINGAGASSKIELLGNLGYTTSKLLVFGATVATEAATGGGKDLSLSRSSGAVGLLSVAMTHIGARYRMSVMKGGYIAGGVGLRMAEGAWFVVNASGNGESEAKSSLNAITADGAVGYKMHFGSIVFGADLLEFSFPLVKMGVKKTPPSDPEYDPADASAQQAAFDKFGAGLSLTIVKLGLGISF
jgi:hypothetical protein